MGSGITLNSTSAEETLSNTSRNVGIIEGLTFCMTVALYDDESNEESQ